MPKNFPARIAMIAIICSAASARAAMWVAEPIVVHEWGVHEFDWSQPRASAEPTDLPAYIYTDTHPGMPVLPPTTRVKDMPPDSGIRKKPILYFYPPTSTSPTSTIPIGIELRFTDGHATAWYPQSNIYRTPEMTAGASEPDWAAWKKANGSRYDPKKIIPVPDDNRMQLAWYSLALSKDLPAGTKLPGENLPADSWTKLARLPNAAYVTNGPESEKYLFYEGATRETPAIAIVPGELAGFTRDPAAPGAHIINISDHPIYNVFAIVHSAGHTWIGYISQLDPMKSEIAPGGGGTTLATLPLPPADPAKITWTDSHSVETLTTDRLLGALTEGGTITIKTDLRDPADPQGKTTSSQLYPDEAAALEKIWHHDFFDAPDSFAQVAPPGEGLTILYRESPATLDAAMPLSIHTDMYHYIQLSRCGIVLNTHIDSQKSMAIYQAISQWLNAPYNPGPETVPRVEAALKLLHENPLLASGLITYMQKLGDDPKRLQLLREQLFPQ